jgi:tetratricopeptide (TPR) repeat protein
VKPAPDKPAPDKPTPDKPTPDKPTPDKPTPGRPTLGRPTLGKPAEADACAGLRQKAAQDPAAALDGFEAHLRQAPNDLRCGSDYRRAVIATKAYDRAIAFFKALVAEHPQAAHAWLNLGYAYVDKIPDEGAITQVLLANTALGHFGTSLELEESWLGFYTRGNSYIFWPAIFGRTSLGIADLEQAIALAEKQEKRDYHARAWAALGDAYWRLDDLVKAREIWRKAAVIFPNNPHLEARLSQDDEGLAAFMEEHFATSNRVDTDLKVLWEGGF